MSSLRPTAPLRRFPRYRRSTRSPGSRRTRRSASLFASPFRVARPRGQRAGALHRSEVCSIGISDESHQGDLAWLLITQGAGHDLPTRARRGGIAQDPPNSAPCHCNWSEITGAAVAGHCSPCRYARSIGWASRSMYDPDDAPLISTLLLSAWSPMISVANGPRRPARPMSTRALRPSVHNQIEDLPVPLDPRVDRSAALTEELMGWGIDLHTAPCTPGTFHATSRRRSQADDRDPHRWVWTRSAGASRLDGRCWAGDGEGDALHLDRISPQARLSRHPAGDCATRVDAGNVAVRPRCRAWTIDRRAQGCRRSGFRHESARRRRRGC